MSKEIIVPTATIEKGEYLLVSEAIGFADGDGQYKYNKPGTIFKDPVAELQPQVGEEILYMLALHFPWNKDEVELPVELGVTRNSPRVRAYTAEDETNGKPYGDIASSWKIHLSKDGWLRLHLFRVPTNKAREVWADPATGDIYKGETKLVVGDLLTELSIRQYSRDRFYSPAAQRAHDRVLAAKVLEAAESGNYPPKLARLKQQEDILDTLIAGAGEQFEEGTKHNAQRVIERANKYVRDERI